MIQNKKYAIIRKELGMFLVRGFTCFNAHLIAYVIVDLFREDYLEIWLNDLHSNIYSGNNSMIQEENNTITMTHHYEDDYIFTCSKEQFLNLINQWNKIKLKDKEFIIIELDESNIIHLYASDAVPADYPFELPPILEPRRTL
ncbi:hypothetical protein K9K77_01005 [Candidatus Babeliales bacterium]|nr:hypothetical protein [Candidatus Babeliales bacterium]